MPEQAPEQARSAPQAQHTQQSKQAQQEKRVDYEMMPRPSPYPLEGDLIAYRLLHIGDDWSPQVRSFAAASVLLVQSSTCPQSS